MKIAIGGDHAGFEYKQKLITYLEEIGHVVEDFGPATCESVDYPDYVHPLAKAITKKTCDLGILICGSANGVAMTANKYKGIRAAICWNNQTATLARTHNDANIICLASRFTSYPYAQSIVDDFLLATFEGGRHQRRVDKIDSFH